jgi:chemotaxis signal transduction protein
VLDGAEPWAVGVDRVARFKSAPGKPQPVPPSMIDANAACYRGVIVDEGSVVLYLAPERLHPNAPRFADAARAIAPPAMPPADGSSRRRPGRILVFYPWNVSRVVGMGRTKFGLSYTQILEIVAGAKATPAPAAADHVLGLIPWRGRAVPVIDIGALLGFEPIGHLGTGRLVVLHSPRWQAPVAVPLGSGVHTHALPLVHRPCRSRLPLNPRYSRGEFELASGEILVLPNIDAVASPPA